METDAPTPEEAAQALHEINRKQADAVRRAFWAPWWFKLGTVAFCTGIGLSFDLTRGALRDAILWGCMVGLFALALVQRRLAEVRTPAFSPQRPSRRVWLYVAGIVVLIFALPSLLARLAVPLPYTIGFFAIGALAMLVGTWLGPREEAKRIAALSDPKAQERASRETFASRHSNRRLWMIYLGVTLGVLAVSIGLIIVAIVLGVPGNVMSVLMPVGAGIPLAAGLLTMRWFHRPLKHQQDVDNA